MNQIRWCRTETRKAKRGWYGLLIDAKGKTWRKFWRPTERWARLAADAYYHDYVGMAR